MAGISDSLERDGVSEFGPDVPSEADETIKLFGLDVGLSDLAGGPGGLAALAKALPWIYYEPEAGAATDSEKGPNFLHLDSPNLHVPFGSTYDIEGYLGFDLNFAAYLHYSYDFGALDATATVSANRTQGEVVRTSLALETSDVTVNAGLLSTPATKPFSVKLEIGSDKGPDKQEGDADIGQGHFIGGLRDIGVYQDGQPYATTSALSIDKDFGGTVLEKTIPQGQISADDGSLKYLQYSLSTPTLPAIDLTTGGTGTAAIDSDEASGHISANGPSFAHVEFYPIELFPVIADINQGTIDFIQSPIVDAGVDYKILGLSVALDAAIKQTTTVTISHVAVTAEAQESVAERNGQYGNSIAEADTDGDGYVTVSRASGELGDTLTLGNFSQGERDDSRVVEHYSVTLSVATAFAVDLTGSLNLSFLTLSAYINPIFIDELRKDIGPILSKDLSLDIGSVQIYSDHFDVTFSDAATITHGITTFTDFTGTEGDDFLTLHDVADQNYVDGRGGDDFILGNLISDTIDGSGGDDSLYGGGGGENDDDILRGGAGWDTLHGNDGDDQLDTGTAGTGAGMEKVYGGNGDDMIYAGTGRDLISGDAGDDRIIAKLGAGGGQSFDGGTGDDTLSADASALSYRFVVDFAANKGSGTLITAATGTQDSAVGPIPVVIREATTYTNIEHILFTAGTADDVLKGTATDDRLDGGAGNDEVHGRDGADYLFGSAGDDKIYGENDEDHLSGGAGQDMLYGGDAKDVVNGDAGDDMVYGDAGDDFLYGGTGSDHLYAGTGQDTLFGDGDNDFLYAGTGQDYLLGNDGDDQLFGGASFDTLEGDDGSDILTLGTGGGTLIGGNGGDRLVVTPNAAVSLIHGDGLEASAVDYNHQDVLVVQNFTGLDTGGGGIIGIGGGGGLIDTGSPGGFGNPGGFGYPGGGIGGANGYISPIGVTGVTVLQTSGTLAGGTHYDGIEAFDLTMGAGDQKVATSYGDDVLRGGDGNDYLDGGQGFDQLYGGDDDDILVGHLGDRFYGGHGTDELVFDGSAETSGYMLWLGEGTTTLDAVGGGSDDTVVVGIETLRMIGGGGGDDSVSGGSVHDLLIGGSGDDTLSGNGGDDLIYAGSGSDTVYGGAGDDLIDGRDDSVLGGLRARAGVVGDHLYGGAGNDQILASNTAIEIEGGSDDDVITISDGGLVFGGAVPKIYGDEGADVITGSSAAEYLYGGADRIDDPSASHNLDDGAIGQDFGGLRATDGADIIHAGGGADFVYGGGANDLLFGEGGDDQIYGGSGVDMLYGGSGVDKLYGGSGNDVLTAGEASGVGVKLLDGGIGNDTLNGSAGADQIYGGDGNDTIDGGGNYNFTSGTPFDTLYGGAGTDVISASGNAVIRGGLGNDTINLGFGVQTVNFIAGDGTDTVNHFTPGEDQVIFSGAGVGYSNLLKTDTADGVRLSFTGSASNLGSVLLAGIHAPQLTASDIVIKGSPLAQADIIAVSSDTLTSVSPILFTANDLGDGVTLTGAGNGSGVVANDAFGNVLLATGATSGSFDYTLTNAYGTGTGHVQVLTAAVTTGDDHIDLAFMGFGAAQSTYVDAGAGDDTVIGLNVANQLFGGAGNDSLTGGFGSDLLYGGDQDDMLYGGAANDVLNGGAGSDLLDGGVGSDTMTGGDGDDTYVVNTTGDQVIELAGGGTDTIKTALKSFSLAQIANVENLTYSGTATFTGTGNALDNRITGGDGNDVLDGGAGKDVLVGGKGNDTYYIDNSLDRVVEQDGEGNDTVIASVGYILDANVEQLILAAAAGANVHAIGNDLDNILRGNELGSYLDGQGGADTLYGGHGNDTFVIDDVGDKIIDTGGTDTVNVKLATYALGAGLENLDFVGVGDFTGTGNTLDNAIYGGIGNDVLDGKGGADTLAGGFGNDLYYVDNVGDIVTELAQHGTDTVIASKSWVATAGSEIEVIQAAAGSTAINLTGNAFDQELDGNAGSNILDGGGGADRMVGGAGNDTYYVDNVGDVVVEQPGEGTDKVVASINYTLTDNVENLDLLGNEGHTGIGNALANVINGTAGGDLLSGLAGSDILSGGDGDDFLYGGTDADTLIGGAGADYLAGGAGADRFKLISVSDSPSSGAHDQIVDFSHAEGDRIDLSGIDANPILTGNQAFAFLGTAAFDHHAGQLRYEMDGTTAHVMADLDGDGIADMIIDVQHLAAPLVVADFVL